VQVFGLAAIAWKWICLGSFSLAAICVMFALIGTERGYYYFYFERYSQWVTRKLRRLHIWTPGSRIASTQTVVLLGIITVACYGFLPYWYGWLAGAALAPAIWLEYQIRQRIAKLEFQAEAFCTALANALKSTPNLAQAVDNASNLLEGPVAQEFTWAVKETRLGKSLDEALQAVGPRCQSPKVGTVLSALLIGRQVGGNLTKVLETTANTLREMERLEGVLRQKTADSRMQMWAMTLAPFIIVYSIHKLDEHFFDPLIDGSMMANIICLVAATFYVFSIVAARKIMAVDL